LWNSQYITQHGVCFSATLICSLCRIQKKNRAPGISQALAVSGVFQGPTHTQSAPVIVEEAICWPPHYSTTIASTVKELTSTCDLGMLDNWNVWIHLDALKFFGGLCCPVSKLSLSSTELVENP